MRLALPQLLIFISAFLPGLSYASTLYFKGSGCSISYDLEKQGDSYELSNFRQFADCSTYNFKLTSKCHLRSCYYGVDPQSGGGGTHLGIYMTGNPSAPSSILRGLFYPAHSGLNHTDHNVQHWDTDPITGDSYATCRNLKPETKEEFEATTYDDGTPAEACSASNSEAAVQDSNQQSQTVVK